MLVARLITASMPRTAGVTASEEKRSRMIGVRPLGLDCGCLRGGARNGSDSIASSEQEWDDASSDDSGAAGDEDVHCKTISEAPA